MLQVLKCIDQVKPLKVDILQRQKEKRNEVWVEEQEVNCPTNGYSEWLTATADLTRYARFQSVIVDS